MPERVVERFRELHAAGCFVIPNPWDVGSARTLVRLKNVDRIFARVFGEQEEVKRSRPLTTSAA